MIWLSYSTIANHCRAFLLAISFYIRPMWLVYVERKRALHSIQEVIEPSKSSFSPCLPICVMILYLDNYLFCPRCLLVSLLTCLIQSYFHFYHFSCHSLLTFFEELKAAC